MVLDVIVHEGVDEEVAVVVALQEETPRHKLNSACRTSGLSLLYNAENELHFKLYIRSFFSIIADVNRGSKDRLILYE